MHKAMFKDLMASLEQAVAHAREERARRRAWAEKNVRAAPVEPHGKRKVSN